MVTDSEEVNNPYLSPRAHGTIPRKATVLIWSLWLLGLAIFLSSLPIAWATFTLADQEYFHILKLRRAIYDIEFNGTPVSMRDAIVGCATVVLIQWALAASLAFASRVLKRRSAC